MSDLFLLSLLGLGDTLDNTDGNGLTHVTDSETSERWEISERFDAHWLGWLKVDDAGISSLDELWVGLENLSGTTVHLLLDVGEFTRNVGSVAIKDRGVSVGDLSRVVHDDDLCLERRNSGSRSGLRVGGDESTAKILDGNVLNVESNVVTRGCLSERFVMHLNGLNFSDNSGRSKARVDTRLDDTGLDTSDWYGSNSTNLVDILKGKTEGLVCWALWRLDSVEGLKKVWSLVPRHVGRLVNHVVTLPSGDRNEWDLHWLVTNLLEVGSDLRLDLFVTSLVVLDGLVVHLVACNNHLLDSKSVSEESVLTGLSILGDTSLESTLGRVDNENGNISLGGSSNHVLDEITVSRSVNDGEGVLWGLELPEGDINGDTTLALGLEVVKNPSILEGTLSELGGFLLVFLDGTLVDTSALVDHVTSSGGLTGIDMANDDQRNVNLFLSHC